MAPSVDQASRDRHVRREHGRVGRGEPRRFGDLLLVEGDLTTQVPGAEAHHELVGERPGLASPEVDVTDLETHLLAHFPAHRVLECLTRLDEPRETREDPGREQCIAGEQGPTVVAFDEHDHRRSEARVGEQPTARTHPGAFAGRDRGRDPTASAVLVGALPFHQLHRPSRDVPGALVDRSPQHAQVGVIVEVPVGIGIDRPTVTTRECPEEDAGFVGLAVVQQHAVAAHRDHEADVVRRTRGNEERYEHPPSMPRPSLGGWRSPRNGGRDVDQ